MDSTNFTPPVRRSMTDAQIHEALGNAQADEAGITAAMELLETQAQLRDIEKMEFASWVIEMERIGSPEALLAVENANRAQQGLPPLDAPTVVAQSVEPIEDAVSRLNQIYAAQVIPDPIQQPEPEPEFELAPEPEPEPASEPEIAPVPEGIAVSNQNDLDEFERLLTADTVVGAEDELTAIEESLFENMRLSSPETQDQSQPISIVEDDPGVEFASVSAVEVVTTNSAPKAARGSRAASQFWAWLALSGSVLPLGLAWYVSTTQISYSQAVLAIFLGATASALVVAVGALAGKRSGLPTLMLSRAPFGVFANAAPASLLTLIRIFWSGAILAVLLSFGSQYFGVQSITNFSSTNSIMLTLVILLVVASAVTLAIFGGRVLFRAQQVAGLLGSAVVLTLVITTAGSFSLTGLLAQPASSWLPVFGIAVLTFSIFGLVWTSAGADFARKLSTSARGASVVGWGALALAVVPTLVAAYGLALLGASNPAIQVGTESITLLQEFSNLLSPWLGQILVASLVTSIVVVLAMNLYSSNLSLHSIGAKLRPVLAQPLLGLVALALAVGAELLLADSVALIADYAIIMAVPVAAWSGIFVSDILIRRIAYHEISLSRGYGFYKAANWVNLSAWVVATILGFGLIYSDQNGFGWTGYLANQMVNQDFWRVTSLGVVISFAFGSLIPVVSGIPRIKRQEAEVLAIESRRDDLKDIFGLVD
jgi:purine-cytosine permease-like protein